MSVPISFLICTEPGRLEQESLLLVESIRKFGGHLKESPIYSFHPRQGKPISSETANAFEYLGVVHQQILLNQEFSTYPLANKPLVCAYAEQNIDSEILVFLDSDQCVFSEPKELLLPPEYNIGMCPVSKKNIGSCGKHDIQDNYWRKLYDILNVKKDFYVNTVVDNKQIRAYWNSGMVSVRRSAGIFQAWKTNFEQVMALNIVPPQGLFFVEQTVLSITVCSMQEDVFSFSLPYNYPLLFHNSLPASKRINSFENMVSIHYHKMFTYNDYSKKISSLKKIDRESIVYQWLCEGLSKQKLEKKPTGYEFINQIKRIERKLSTFKVKINLSNFIERLLSN